MTGCMIQHSMALTIANLFRQDGRQYSDKQQSFGYSLRDPDQMDYNNQPSGAFECLFNDLNHLTSDYGELNDESTIHIENNASQMERRIQDDRAVSSLPRNLQPTVEDAPEDAEIADDTNKYADDSDLLFEKYDDSWSEHDGYHIEQNPSRQTPKGMESNDSVAQSSSNLDDVTESNTANADCCIGPVADRHGHKRKFIVLNSDDSSSIRDHRAPRQKGESNENVAEER